MTTDTDKKAAAVREVEEFHQFFQDWFTGTLPRTAQAFARFSDNLAPDFELISPRGDLLARSALVNGLEQAHGKLPKTIKIWVRDVKVRSLGAGLWLATYEEWQDKGDGERGRLSTVVFREHAASPNGMLWLHVHETWLPDAK
ncbi:DUF4440 domain-containing protein [Acanthopleuribacter pedis]